MTDTDFARRLEKLERDNRRLKRLAVCGLAIAASLGVLYAVACSGVRNAVDTVSSGQKVTAREFDMVDSAGKVRMKLAMNCPQGAGCQPEIQLFDPDGEPVTSLRGDRLQFNAVPKGGAPHVTAELGSGSGGGGLLSLTGAGASHVRVDANAPLIEIKDSLGYTMDLGSVSLTTVETGQTSPTTADSIVMFGSDKEHHLIWRVP